MSFRFVTRDALLIIYASLDTNSVTFEELTRICLIWSVIHKSQKMVVVTFIKMPLSSRVDKGAKNQKSSTELVIKSINCLHKVLYYFHNLQIHMYTKLFKDSYKLPAS